MKAKTRGQTTKPEKKDTQRKGELDFDPEVFFERATETQNVVLYKRNEKIFSQGAAADALFYIRKGKVKLTVNSRQAKKPSLPFWAPQTFSARDAWLGSPYVREPPSQWSPVR